MTTLATITPTDTEYAIMRSQAESLVKTGFLPQAIKTPEQALAIMLTGRELGIPAMAALNTINVIQGKPAISPQLMLALIERSGQLEDIEFQIDPDGRWVSVIMKRKGRSAHNEVFGENEAKAMGLLSKDNYRKQPTVMYKWRAVAAAARTVFPDVILGLYTPDEMGAEVSVSEDGEMTVESFDDWQAKLRETGQAVIDRVKREAVDSAKISATVSPKKAKADLPQAAEPKPTKRSAVKDELKKAEWIAYCGKGFRTLNELNLGPKWNGESINQMILTEFGVEGGIHNLTLAQVEQLAKTLDGWYMQLTEMPDNPEVYDGDGNVIEVTVEEAF